jgi:leucyl-tRNA synthetase
MTLRISLQYFGFTIYDLCQRMTAQGCHSRAISDPWLSLFPHTHHIAEELWSLLGNEGSIATVPFPVFEQTFNRKQ